jgi:hypothetical protein
MTERYTDLLMNAKATGHDGVWDADLEHVLEIGRKVAERDAESVTAPRRVITLDMMDFPKAKPYYCLRTATSRNVAHFWMNAQASSALASCCAYWNTRRRSHELPRFLTELPPPVR